MHKLDIALSQQNAEVQRKWIDDEKQGEESFGPISSGFLKVS